MGAAADDRLRDHDEAAAAALRRSADVLVRSGNSRIRTSLETAAGGTRLTIRGHGEFDYTRRLGRLRIVLPRDASGTVKHRPITEILTPGALYMKDRGAGVPPDKWVRVNTAELADGNLVTGGATDPLSAAELLSGAEHVTYVGTARAADDGVIVRHYRGTTDIGRAARAASPYARPRLLAAARGFAEDTVRFDAYLDDRGRLRRVRHRFTLSTVGGSGEAVGAPRTTEVVSTTELYGYGAGVKVTLPAQRDIYAGAIGVPRA
jgi:hypothetical protein